MEVLCLYFCYFVFKIPHISHFTLTLSWPSLHTSLFQYQQRNKLLQRKMFKKSSSSGTKQVRNWTTDLLAERERGKILNFLHVKLWDSAEL